MTIATQRRITLLSIVVILAILNLSMAETPAASPTPDNRQYGFIEYAPALGKISLDEGTCEIWFTTDFDIDVPLPNGQAILFTLATSNGKNMYTVAFRKFNYGTALSADGRGKINQSMVFSAPIKWKAGEMHHATYTWKGKQRTIYVDGIVGDNRGKSENGKFDIRPVYEKEGPLEGDLENGRIQVGCYSSPFSVDEIRISSVVRTPEEIQKSFQSGPVEDAYTLFIDHCNGVTPGDPPTPGFRLGGVYEVVDGKFGKAIQLWNRPK